MYDVIIVGAGASGLMAASVLSQANKGIKLLVLEHLPIAGKKILASGNGRCNLSNENVHIDHYNDPSAAHVLNAFTNEDVINYFKRIGLLTKKEAGRYYPYTNQAASLQEALVHPLNARKRIKYEVHVSAITYQTKCFTLTTNQGVFQTKYLMMATGGMTGNKQGSDGSGYELVKSLGHRVTTLKPGIVQIKVKQVMGGLKGIRCLAHLKLMQKNIVLIEDSGELQLTDQGLSGIPSFQLSRLAKPNMQVYIDFIPVLKQEEVKQMLEIKREQLLASAVLNIGSGLVHPNLFNWILKQCAIDSTMTNKKLTDTQLENIATQLKQTKLDVADVLDFTHAQVTVGGVHLDEINMDTLESKCCDKLYICGELLDIDGACGGYNLQWAWSSGYVSAQSVLDKIDKEIKS